MNDYRKVLVHVSGNDRSPKVLICAANLAAEQGAALHAVHAIQPIHLGAHLSPETAMLAFQLRQNEERLRTSKAREQVHDRRPQGPADRTRPIERGPAWSIVLAATSPPGALV